MRQALRRSAAETRNVGARDRRRSTYPAFDYIAGGLRPVWPASLGVRGPFLGMIVPSRTNDVSALSATGPRVGIASGPGV